MAKVYLDTNIFLDLVEKRRTITRDLLSSHDVYLSPLSIQILCYVTRRKIPSIDLTDLVEQFTLIPFDDAMTKQALTGPTKDFEDNVQLHSAAEAECHFFLTEDKKLLDLKFFGKTRLVKDISAL